MSKVCASVLMEFLVFAALFAGVSSLVLNFMPQNRDKKSINSALRELNVLVSELVATSIEQQVATRIAIVIKNDTVNCVGQVYDGSGFALSKSRSLAFSFDQMPIVADKSKQEASEYFINIDSKGVIRPLPIKIKILSDKDRNSGNEVFLDWLVSRLVYKQK